MKRSKNTREKNRSKALDLLSDLEGVAPFNLRSSAERRGSIYHTLSHRMTDGQFLAYASGGVDIHGGRRKSLFGEGLRRKSSFAQGKRGSVGPGAAFVSGTAGETEQDVKKESKLKNRLTREWIVFRAYLLQVSESNWFSVAIMITIICNSITAAFSFNTAEEAYIMALVEVAYLAIYTFEFLIKIVSDPKEYFTNSYSRFDFLILIISFIQLALDSGGNGGLSYLRVIRALRALRALRIISFFRSLQVLITALVKTLTSNVLDLLSLLGLCMFLFAILGFYFFGEEGSGDPVYWGNLGIAFMTLFSHVTADNWTGYQYRLMDLGMSGTQWFSIIFIFIGHFLFTNLFIAVIIQNIHEATEADKKLQSHIRHQHVLQKRAMFLEKQTKGPGEIANRKFFRKQNLENMINNLTELVRHDDVLPMEHLSCNITWLETFMTTLYHQENTMYRCQQIHFDMANVLTELVEKRRQTRDSLI